MAPPVIIMGNLPGPDRWMVPSVPMESVPRHYLRDEITDYDKVVPLYPGHEFGWGMGGINEVLYGTPIPQKAVAGLGAWRPSPLELPSWRKVPRQRPVRVRQSVGQMKLAYCNANPQSAQCQGMSGMGQTLAPGARWPFSAQVAAGFAPIPAPLMGLGAAKAKAPPPPTTVTATGPAPVESSTMYAVAGVAAAAVVASAALYIFMKGRKR